MEYINGVSTLYIRKFKHKLDQYNVPGKLPDYFAPLIGDKKEVKIAELGAGPINTIGNEWPGVKVEIYASDNLVAEYNKLWKQYKAKPIVPVRYENMENLSYPNDFFDIVHCRNALDHTLHAVAAVKEMRRICKPGGWIYIMCSEYQKDTYGGMHAWNARLEDGDDFIMRDGPDGDFYIKKILEGAKSYDERDTNWHDNTSKDTIVISV